MLRREQRLPLRELEILLGVAARDERRRRVVVARCQRGEVRSARAAL
jgi:hypothetical protein